MLQDEEFGSDSSDEDYKPGGLLPLLLAYCYLEHYAGLFCLVKPRYLFIINMSIKVFKMSLHPLDLLYNQQDIGI